MFYLSIVAGLQTALLVGCFSEGFRPWATTSSPLQGYWLTGFQGWRVESGVIDCVPLVFFVVTTISTGSRLWAAIASGCEPCAIVAHGDAVGNVTNSIMPLQWAYNLSRSTTERTLRAPCMGIWWLPVAAPVSTVGYDCIGLQARIRLPTF